MGLSLTVPGAGQVYNRHWIKAGVAALIEGLAWTGYGIWKGRGIQTQEDHRSFASNHWNPVRYAR